MNFAHVTWTLLGKNSLPFPFKGGLTMEQHILMTFLSGQRVVSYSLDTKQGFRAVMRAVGSENSVLQDDRTQALHQPCVIQISSCLHSNVSD